MSSGKGNKKVTIGYKYYVGMHLVLCQAPIDAILGIKVGDDTAWEGTVASGNIYINKPDLFGGERSGGGIVGNVTVLPGDAAQQVNAYLAQNLGADIPAYRGVVSLVLNKIYICATNPYIKAWSVKVRWFDGNQVGSGMNAAHIIYKILTDRVRGLGLGDENIDLTSFTAAKTTLKNEGFGLSFVWDHSSTAESFITNVLTHIDGFIYIDINTGKITLKLIRDDYNEADLPVLNEDNILKVSSFSRKTAAELTNTIVLNYDDANGATQSITVHNAALLDQQGGQIISESKTFDGITDGTLAQKVALRELRTASSALSVAQVVLNKDTGINLRLGDVVKVNWAKYNIENEIMRITSINYGNVTANSVTVDLQQDVYAIGVSVNSPPPSTGWVNPIGDPVASPRRLFFETPYYFWALAFGDIESAWNELGDLQGSYVMAAQRPSGDSYSFDLYLAGQAYALETSGAAFTPFCTTTSALAKEVVTTVGITGADLLEEVETGTLCAIEGEICEVTNINLTNGTITLNRGMLDTVPAAHASGVAVWFFAEFAEFGSTFYYRQEVIKAKCLTVNPRGTLDLSAAPIDTLTFSARQIRPYVAGNFRFNNVVYPATITGPLTVSWAHRSRLLQTSDTHYAQTAANIGPEQNITYTLKLYDENGSLRKTVTGLTGTSYTWDTETADSNLTDRLNNKVRAVLTAVRVDGTNTWESWQSQDHTAIRE